MRHFCALPVPCKVRFALLGLAALLTSLPAGAAEPRIVKKAGLSSVELSPGERVTPALPEGAELSAAYDTASGWLATGTRPAEGGREIVLLTGRGAAARALSPPPGRGKSLRAEPTALVTDGRFAALAWLEGADRKSLGLRVASWDGAVWGESRLIAPPGPGSQLALAAAPLGDGSWLLAWSAFDGQDDEIVWSRGRLADPTSWSAPQKATENRVPDITPALAPLGSGAALAWSTFDGREYRTVVARFEGRGFGPAAPLGGGGALFPSFAREDGALQVLVQKAEPRGWEVWSLDGEARPVARALAVTADTAETDRPVVVPGSAGTVTLRWPTSERRREIPLESPVAPASEARP